MPNAKLISSPYLKTQQELHETGPYGSSGHYWLGHVAELMEVLGAHSLIDYGAGKATLGPYCTRLGYHYQPYDPVTFPTRPKPAQVVVCLDVLEHIEPESLSTVLDDIQKLALTAVFLVVATRPSGKSLSDGRNAHLIVEDYTWWKRHLLERWKSVRTRQFNGGFEMVLATQHPSQGNAFPRKKVKELRGV